MTAALKKSPRVITESVERPTINNVSRRSLDALQAKGLLPTITPALEAVARQFSVSVTPAMLELINPLDQKDPIAAQFVPSESENHRHPLEKDDPIGDQAFTPVEGIVHRYPDRVLLKPLLLCPVYCRFCFRREQISDKGHVLSNEALEKAIAYIADHPEIWEVILSGGDPLMLSDQRISSIIKKLNAISHVKVIRLHSRLPVVDPQRITPALVKALKGRAAVYLLLHCNHPRELTAEARNAVALLVDGGIPLLSQSVLLKNINDHPETLATLMRAFVECRIKPHYLHHPDLVPGTLHFRVPLEEGQKLVASLRGDLSGLAQPSYTLDIPGGFGKIPVGLTYATQEGDGWVLKDPWGQTHVYKEPRPSSKG